MNLNFRKALIDDLPAIVRMLADDFLGAQRERFEHPLPESYFKAFHEIESDPNNELIVAVLSEPPAVAGGLTQSIDTSNPQKEAEATRTLAHQSVVGTMQLIFTPSISFQGGKRCTVESVRVDTAYRGNGIGRRMMLWAIERAKEKNCISMQLTTNNDRPDAHRFYAELEFSTTHVGMKLKLK